jgi:predicted GH43/DUF377 family glycosyl hydrolase
MAPPSATAAPTRTSPPPTSTAAPTAAPTRTAEPSPAPTETEALIDSAFAFEVLPRAVLRNGFEGARQFIDPGAVLVHDGVFHMFYNGINSFPAPVGVGYATSTDGLTWERQVEAPIFDRERAGLPSGANLFAGSAVVEDDGTWVLYYYIMEPGGNFEGRQTIGRATAPEPTGPWTPHPEPVLVPGPEGAWDAHQVSSPHVLRIADGYVMYYDGFRIGTSGSRIGLATSPDGINWTKHDDPATTEARYAESDPVLEPTTGTFDERRVMDPNVLPTDDGWVMVYSTGNGSAKFNGSTFDFGLAASPDGVTWTKVDDAPILRGAEQPGWRAIYLASMVEHEGQYYLYFDVGTGGTNVHLATYAGDLTP